MAPSPTSPIAERLFIAAALAAITLIVYAPVRHYDFVALDDPLYVSENPHVGSLTAGNIAWAWTHVHAGFWIPLVWMSYMLDAEVFGPGPAGPHVTNLALHVFNTLTLFWALMLMTSAAWRSGVVAALFAVHPLRVESVAWITERKDVLSACFWMLALLAYIRYVRQRRASRYAMVTVCFVAGLLAKPMVVTLPLVLLLLDVWPLRRHPSERLRTLVIEKLPLFAIALGGSVVAFFAQEQAGAVGNLGTYSVGGRISNALVSYVTYLGKTAWPQDLSVLYSHPHEIPVMKAAAAAAVLSAISLVAVRTFRRQPAILVGWLWFVVTLLPTIGLIQVGVQSMADRFTYLPLIGIFVAAVWGIADGIRLPRAALATIAAAVIAAYAATARHQLGYWKDSVALWTRATELSLNVDSYSAHVALGDVLNAQGRAAEAIAHFTEATRLRPDSTEARHKLGLALAGQGRIDEAAAAFAEVIRIDPRSAAAHADLALALTKLNKLDQALEQYMEALRLNPDLPEAQNGVGAILAQNGRMRESVPHFAEAIRLNPDFEGAHQNLAIAFVNLDQLDDAEREFKEVRRINPQNAIATRALAELEGRRNAPGRF